MKTVVIHIPEKKSALVKKLLKELGVTISRKSKKSHIPNALTAKTIEHAHNGIGMSDPITNIDEYVKSL